MVLNACDAAMLQMASVVGPQHVITDAGVLAAAETSTFATRRHIPGVIRPANRAEVQECLRIANRFRVAV